jgi:hypothetical protein
MNRLAGKAAIVTGAASGNGRAMAVRFAAEGADVVVADVDAAGAEETARLVGAQGRRGLALRCDVSHKAEIERWWRPPPSASATSTSPSRTRAASPRGCTARLPPSDVCLHPSMRAFFTRNGRSITRYVIAERATVASAAPAMTTTVSGVQPWRATGRLAWTALTAPISTGKWRR